MSFAPNVGDEWQYIGKNNGVLILLRRTSRRMHGIFGERERARNDYIRTSQPRLLTTCSLEPRRLQASVRHQRVQRMPPNGREFSPWLAARACKKLFEFIEIISDKKKRVLLTQHDVRTDVYNYI